MEKLTLTAGFDKTGGKEDFGELVFEKGLLYAIVGPTGSGKSRLIKDLEMLVVGDSVTKRRVFIDGKEIPLECRASVSQGLIAHLSQSMNFVLDLPISDFLFLHSRAAGLEPIDVDYVVEKANTVTEERISPSMNLSELSGGQSRALMIADVALVSNRSVVLADEIENAGIDKEAALSLLLSRNKLVLIATHDVHTALFADFRVVMKNGGIKRFIEKSAREEALFEELEDEYRRKRILQNKLRKGEALI